MPLSARALAVQALRRWRVSRDFADAVIHRMLAASELNESDRGFAQELFYGVLRNFSLLNFYISRLRKTKVDSVSRDLLRLGLYQLFLLRMPEHAAIFETVEIAPRSGRALVNGVLRNAARQREELENDAATAPLYVRESHPEWLLSRWQKSFGQEAAVSLARWNNQHPPIYARVNTLRISPAEFAAKYPGLRPVADHPFFFHCDSLPRQAIALGHCYIQDPSTALPVELLQPTPGEIILDACAAPGGKTAHIAALTRNQAQITACDRDPSRIDLLRANLARLGASAIALVKHDWLPDEFESKQFDKILLDAPCTNSGVMRRRVDVRWRLRLEDFARMHERQIAIARAVIGLLKPGGVFVYSTCSLDREENEDVAGELSRAFPQLELERTRSVLPFRDGFDGAFAVRFVHR